MLAIYLSGTGNTKHCIEKLAKLIDENTEILPIESEGIKEKIAAADDIILGYPTQFSNAPIMVRDFIKHNDIWRGKRVLCVATMGLFSGDGAGCAARLLRKQGAEILGGLHIHMPDSISDNKMLKKSLEENKAIIAEADRKIERTAAEIRSGKYPTEGIRPYSRAIGLFGQRLWFYGKTLDYSDKLKISDECIGCGKCSSVCPMKNLSIKNGRVETKGSCTMCYRCVSQCPKKAITLLGSKIYEQCRFDRYV
ncbi:EFR1 family ferrodoxin [Ruminococcus sp.]|uniref:EFR1 family ferrodoxin n=1 Tax=Ruminococcus sp. TaxID=41978 RepID=UPI0025EED80B|nr:EFR1 family ferrodoxin [Ruminococcus sp.]MBQ8965483.1 EFR1 family ferrodoxin [Ruminococcus sp.]